MAEWGVEFRDGSWLGSLDAECGGPAVYAWCFVTKAAADTVIADNAWVAAAGGMAQQIRIEKVDHPAHYGGADNAYETIRVIEAWGLGFCLGNAVKYISRAGKKDPAALVEDLEKARWYLDHEIARLKAR